jgi:transposase
VSSARGGLSLREVARRFGVALSTVQYWVARAGDRRLDRVDFSDRSRCPQRQPTRTEPSIEERVLDLREELKVSPLGEYGASAIRYALEEEQAQPLPSERTIHRILQRHGVLDVQRRVRRPAPPPGWHLPDVAAKTVELDQADIVNGLAIAGFGEVETLNMVSLHGGLVDSFVAAATPTRRIREALLVRWRSCGLPGYAQFDNDTRFLGPSNRPDILGSVPRMCLSLQVVPVFAPPRETGFQAAIERYNGLWQEKVWEPSIHADLVGLVSASDRYVAASHRRHAQRIEGAPVRRPFPADWTLTKARLQVYPSGLVIFLRRTDDHGCVSVLGHTFPIDAHWVHRLVRCELDLDAGRVRFLGLRRAQPAVQPLLGEAEYLFPHRRFDISDLD